MNITNVISNTSPRPGCVDLWNSFMVKDASFCFPSEIPICPCTMDEPPVQLIAYDDAKTLYNKEMKKGNPFFKVNAWIHFYIDDQKFDGKESSIWLYPDRALEVIKHFSGVITPDFSTYLDFPDPIKRYNTYRMRAFGCWMHSNEIPVINNVRWGTEETWSYCFEGIPEGSVVAIGTIASKLKTPETRYIFEKGFSELIKIIHPRMIIIYGSDNHPIIVRARKKE
ncbi:MAG: DUF4417 domain-containing protein [Lachnospiraceae bacterium]|nr:DUF4417 domain-containing protein [Lachnospiraceae bacterium]